MCQILEGTIIYHEADKLILKIDYPAYFYATGGVASEWDIDLAKKLAQKIIEITKDDKYNKYRLDAEDVLKAFDKEEIR